MALKNKAPISSNFLTVAERRDKLAEDYFSSDKFLHQMRNIIESNIVQKRASYAELEYPTIDARPKDLPVIKEAFKKLKQEYPDLNHIRISKAGSIVVDMEPDTWLRRTWSAPALRGVTPPF